MAVARFATVSVLPSPGKELVTNRTKAPDSNEENRILVRNTR